MRNRRLYFFLLINCLFLIGIVFATYHTKQIITKHADELIVVSSFSVNGEADNLKYRLLEKGQSGIIQYASTVKGTEFWRINSDFYKLVIYRLAGHWYKVYFNGELIGSVGNMRNDSSNIWNSIHAFDIDGTKVKDVNELVIEVFATYETGASSFPIIITNPILAGEIFDWFSFGLLNFYWLIIGVLLFSFLVIVFLYILSQRFKKEYFYFSIASVSSAIFLVDYIPLYALPISITVFKQIIMFFMYFSNFTISVAVYKRFRQKVNLYLGYLLMAGIVIAIFASRDMVTFKLFFNYLNILIFLNTLGWIYTTWRFFKKAIDAQIIFQASVVLLIFAGLDIYYMLLGKYPPISFGVYGIFQFSLAMIIMVVFNYLDLQKRVLSETQKSNLMYQRSVKDGMTGTYNHQFICSTLQKIKKAYSVIMLDIDDFKSVNDTYGHQIGDMVIKYVAEEIKLNVRKTDLVGRYGGDEFVIILFQCPSAQAKMIAEKINARAQETHRPDGINEIKVTLSMGVYSASEGENGETALSKVDKALYCSKSRGKNQVTSYEELYGEFRE